MHWCPVFSDLQRGLWRESYWSFKWCFQKKLSDLPLPMCLFVVLSSWKNMKKKEAEFRSLIFFFVHLSVLFSGQFCLNYWFVEEATRVHCGLCQSQTIVYHYSALFFRQASFFGQGQTTFESPGGRRVLVRRGQRADRFCLVHSTFILKKSAFCWLVYLHTQVWPKLFATEGTVERLFNFWWLRDGFLARLSYDWSIWQPESDL